MLHQIFKDITNFFSAETSVFLKQKTFLKSFNSVFYMGFGFAPPCVHFNDLKPNNNKSHSCHTCIGIIDYNFLTVHALASDT